MTGTCTDAGVGSGGTRTSSSADALNLGYAPDDDSGKPFKFGLLLFITGKRRTEQRHIVGSSLRFTYVKMAKNVK